MFRILTPRRPADPIAFDDAEGYTTVAAFEDREVAIAEAKRRHGADLPLFVIDDKGATIFST